MSQHTSSLTLLCVEDNKTTQFLYDAILSDLVKKIIFADDGEDGYQKYLNNKVDIILSDYDMPILNGLGMIEKVREIDKEIPIILISAIDDIDIVVKSLQLGVNNFVKKPIVNSEVLKALNTAAKLIIANKFLQDQRDKELNTLQEKESYNSYQEDLAFAKELNILRNDFYYQMVGDKNNISLVDFLYQPLDVVSGDAYTARRIDQYRTFYLIVDGMGKGLSASLSAMIMTSFVNHLIDRMIEYDSFSMDILVKESMDYIKPILLDEEALAIDYILFDNHYNKLHYSKFAMPIFLLQDKDDNIIKIKSNNPPLSKWQTNYVLEQYDIEEIEKFLFYSDGIVENSVKGHDDTYAQHIENDFKHSFTREEFKDRMFKKIVEQEDDLTLIFINKLNFNNSLISKKTFDSSLESVDSANEWYNETWSKLSKEIKISYGANVVFTELFMNAYEHGNLGINSHQKHKMLENDTYFDTLLEKEKTCSKKIHVQINKIKNLSSSYIITQITDEGEGFDTQILSEIFRNSQTFNGRGVFVSRKNSMGIYYNTDGNSVLYLNKI